MLPSLSHTEQSHVTDWKDIFKQHTKTVGLGAEDPNQVLLLLLGYMLLGALWNCRRASDWQVWSQHLWKP